MHSPLKATLVASALLTLGQPAQAQTQTQTPAGDAPGTVVRAGDDALTCPQMADEAATISASMGEQGPGLLGRVTGVARAGAAMLVPGAGLALAGADALTSPGKDKKEAEADARRDRWNYLNGLYAGRGCGETAAQPATTAVSATASTSPAVAIATPAAPTVAQPMAQTAARNPAPAPAPAITPAAFPH